MALVTMVRSAPEVPNGPIKLELPECDVPILEKRGWAVEGKKAEKPVEPVKEEPKEEPKKNDKFGKMKGKSDEDLF